jgi:hypothetical protein
MKSFDVVGYTDGDGGVYCPGCAADPENMNPIFVDSEWDYYPTCDACQGVIDEVGLTCYGYEQERLRKFFSMLHDERQARKFKVLLSSPNAGL